MSNPDATTTAVAQATPGSAGGRTVVVDSVVEKIAGLAVREVPGVRSLGSAAGRAIGAIRSRLNQADPGQGISVEVGETQIAVDVSIVAEYPIPLQTVADQVRTTVTEAIETLVGKEVTEVNVTVTDVALPGERDEDASGAEPRVQ